MALAVPNPPPNDRKRVKVYELRNNDWFDRGTGFCTGQIINVRELLGRWGCGMELMRRYHLGRAQGIRRVGGSAGAYASRITHHQG